MGHQLGSVPLHPACASGQEMCTLSLAQPLQGGQVREAASFHSCGFRCLADVRPERFMEFTVSGAQLRAEAFLQKLTNH